jgi:hypothetical protein
MFNLYGETMREVLKTPNQLALDFELARENADTKASVKFLSNVVAVDFTQQRNVKLQAVELEETDLILERVLSNARKLSW